MRAQNDKLRLNMKAMIKAGGDETKILEQQNFEFQQENNLLKDELAVLEQTQMNLVSEIQMARNEVQLARESLIVHVNENSKLKSEILNLQELLRSRNIAYSELTGKTSALQTEISELHRRLSAEVERHESSEAEHLDMYESRMKGKDDKIQQLDSMVSKLSADVRQLKYDLETRISLSMKSEQSKNEEIARLEKLVGDTSKHFAKIQEEAKESFDLANETITHLTNSNVQLHAELEKAKNSTTFSIPIQSPLDIDSSVDLITVYPTRDCGLDGDDSARLVDTHLEEIILDRTDREIATNISSERCPPFTTSQLLNTESESSIRQDMYKIYLEKRLAYAMVLESDRSIGAVRVHSSDVRYETLKSALELASVSLKFSSREEVLLREFINRENYKILEELRLREERVENLELLTKTLSHTQEDTQHELESNRESISSLHKHISDLQSQLHMNKLEIVEVVAKDRAKHKKILELEKDLQTSLLFTSDARVQIERASMDVELLSKEKTEMTCKLQCAERQLLNMEERYNLLLGQASEIEKERNDIVEHFLKLKT